VSEFEAMVKVFFADAGSLDQLRATIDAIEASARDRVAALGELVDRSLADGPVFPERRHISALTLRLQLTQETAVMEWTAWARKQLSSWASTTEPATWDDRAALTELRSQIQATRAAQ
jgi:hypothetical protein